MDVSRMDKGVELLWRDKYDYNKVIGEADDYILVNGGDGTLLRAIFMYSDKNKPFYGRAGGSVNFLMNPEKIPNVVDGHEVITFKKLEVTVSYFEYRRDMASLDDTKKVEFIKTFQAFNDIAIGGSDGMNAFINFKVEDKNDILGEFKGGGMIVSTPQGSTGINKTNHGSILALESKQWSITGDKTTRPVRYVVEPSEITITPTSRKSVILWIDGDKAVIDNVTKVVVNDGESVEVIFNDYGAFKRKRRG